MIQGITKIFVPFQKYFIPVEEGIYKIILKFDINLTDCSNMFSECANIMEIKFY